jgi:hypothetical protein
MKKINYLLIASSINCRLHKANRSAKGKLDLLLAGTIPTQLIMVLSVMKALIAIGQFRIWLRKIFCSQ